MLAGDSFLTLLPFYFQDAERIQRVIHSHAFLVGNLAVQPLPRADGVFQGFYTKLQFDSVGLENGGFVARAPVILDRRALLRGGILCSGGHGVSAVACQGG